jgi:hypothetical protein
LLADDGPKEPVHPSFMPGPDIGKGEDRFPDAEMKNKFETED